jgi:signal transduction histidine kinase
MTVISRQAQEIDVFSGGGEMGAMLRAIDWSRNPLGPVDQWSQALRTTVGLLLRSRFPMLLWWGPRFVQLYNDTYVPIPGAKHPKSLGQPGSECWAEIWDIIGPMAEAPYSGGPASTSDDLCVLMERRGFPEETHFIVAYSPVPDETVPGTRVGGVLATVTETTAQVYSERQLKTLGALGARSAEAKTPHEACEIAAATFGENDFDLPFALFYLLDPDHRTARLAASCGFAEAGGDANPVEIDVESSVAPWPVKEVAGSRASRSVHLLRERFAALPKGRWADTPHTAVALPLASPDQAQPYGVLIAGLNPHRLFDDGYRTFLDLAASQVVTSIRNAVAIEETRRRAERLAELDRAKTLFFSNVSHEFRTPLTLMLGPIEDSLGDRSDPLSPAHRERAVLARRNGLRLQKLVNSLLDFSRLEAGRSQAVFAPADLSAMTSDLASGFRSAVEKAGLEFVVDCPPLPEPLYVDASMWEKIVLNLLSNAFKYTHYGRIRVAIAWKGDRAVLSVEDTGIGVAPEELPRLFERFHRVEGARGRSHEGSGIGLALVHELVKLHGGRIDVESAPGKGTTFRVSVPAGLCHLPADRIGAAASGGAGPEAFLSEISQWSAPAELPRPEAAGTGARILVVDDNADMRDYVARILAPRWRVETAADGAQALAAARATPPDLVLSDVMMPVMDGLALVRELRSDPATRSIPVVLLSARAGEEATVDGLKSGADAYLVKPFSASELVARVDAQLSVSNVRREELRRERDGRLVAERASHAGKQIAAVVSHDLRSPLSSMVNAASSLGRGLEKDAPLQYHVAVIQRAAQRMNRMIADLLDIASMDAGTFSIERGSHRADEIVWETIETYRPQAAEKGLELSGEVAENLPPLACDRDRLLQVLFNLASNSVKFTPPGGRIALKAERDGGDFVFHVIDTGRGLVQVKSEVEKGSTFSFRIPSIARSAEGAL